MLDFSLFDFELKNFHFLYSNMFLKFNLHLWSKFADED